MRPRELLRISYDAIFQRASDALAGAHALHHDWLFDHRAVKRRKGCRRARVRRLNPID
jgi:hypothetical protein